MLKVEQFDFSKLANIRKKQSKFEIEASFTNSASGF